MSWWHDQAGRFPLLTPTQETLLGRQVREWLDHPDPVPPAVERRGKRARERFVRANLKLVISFAEKYRSVPRQYEDDLIQAGNMGLIKAVERFDPARGYKFSTYAYWWIRQGIHAFLEHHGRCIRLPTTHSAQYTKIQTAILDLTAQLNRKPSRREIADHLGWTVETLERISTRPVATLSLDQPNLSSDDSVISDAIADPAGALMDGVESAEELDQLLAAICMLDSRAQRIMIDQFLSPVPSTVHQLARAEKVTRDTIRAIVNRSILQLRQILMGQLQTTEPPTCEPVEDGEQLVLFGLG